MRLTRKEKVEAQKLTPKSQKRKIDVINIILAILFLSGLGLTVCEINLYRETIINWIIPTSIWILSGLILTPLTYQIWKRHFEASKIYWQIFCSIIAIGGIIIYGFMASNYYFPSKEERQRRVEIMKTGHLAKGRHGCGNPYAVINIDGVEKELIYFCDVEIDKYKFVNLTIKRGLFGFDIITNKTLIEE